MLTLLIFTALIWGPALAHTPAEPGAAAGSEAGAIAHPQDAVRRDRLRRMLSMRDSAPACTAVAAQTDTRLVADLQWLMDHIKAPPWVGVRAAECIIELRAETELKRIVGWVQDPTKPGLVLVVLGRLNTLPEALAVDIARAALGGPHTTRVASRLVKSRHPEVRALVAPGRSNP